MEQISILRTRICDAPGNQSNHPGGFGGGALGMSGSDSDDACRDARTRERSEMGGRSPSQIAHPREIVYFCTKSCAIKISWRRRAHDFMGAKSCPSREIVSCE